ncbi:hypothetical protein GCM10009812_09410 [Nocardioides marinus]
MGWLRKRPPAPSPAEPWDGVDTEAADVAARAAGFQDAAHQQASARGKARRAARTPADQVARAKQVGVVSRAEYLEPQAEAAALHPGPGGFPDARLERVRDRLLVVTPAGWVNPKSRSAHKWGLHSFQLRGTSYHTAAVRAGRFTPGTAVRLVREPNNPHDPNAISVWAEGAKAKAGYVPGTRAKALARLLDGGADLVAVSVRGAGPGREGAVPQVLVCERELYEHLTR